MKRRAPDAPIFARADAPQFWLAEKTGLLKPAVERFVDHKPLSLRDVALLRKYFIQWIDSPVWSNGELSGADKRELAALRAEARNIYSDRSARAWHLRAQRFAADPI